MLKNVGVLLIGTLIGVLGGGRYFYNKLNETGGALTIAKSEAASASKTLRERDEQLQKFAASASKTLQERDEQLQKLAASTSKTLRERDEQLQKVKDDLTAAENTLKGAVRAKESAKASAIHPSHSRIRGGRGGAGYTDERAGGPRHAYGWGGGPSYAEGRPTGPGYGYGWGGGPSYAEGRPTGPGYGYGWDGGPAYAEGGPAGPGYGYGLK